MAVIAEIRMSLSRNPSTGPTTESRVSRKRHAACDECRQRKLKCSGEAGGCSRCVKQSLYCHYSIQKPMGRPPKSRARQENAHTAITAPQFPSCPQSASGVVQVPPFSLAGLSRAVPGTVETPYTSYMMSPGLFVASSPMYGEQGHEHASIQLPSSPYPTPPSYSQTCTIGMCTPPATSTAFPGASIPGTAPEAAYRQLQPLAPCSCVSYIAVIYCEVCPQTFNSFVQNLMILGSLLNVIGDTWLKVSQMNAEQLGSEILSPTFIASLPSEPGERERRWKRWLRHVVRHGVIGSTITPMVDAVQDEISESPNLLSLIQELEARQRWWHAPRDPIEYRTGMLRPNGDLPARESGQSQDTEYMCTRIAGTAREVIDRFEFDDEEMMG
ncbi:hypothetical protein ACJ72_05214 [Emergomyces africanus]|uniref:Zn(2)-C6 fungal-type domain-containing protein n=1 Tax=Emergomyces africanus TaxID=1955775 RepID=A0A1B7NUK4_9EURO|nr:hypothetical protein ACJ72_05214 [Emergomyces africanus]